MSVKVRVIGVVVQPVLVVDDGVDLTPIPVDSKQISAKEWPTYAASGFKADIAALQARLNEEAERVAKPKPNRAQRRAAKTKPSSKAASNGKGDAAGVPTP